VFGHSAICPFLGGHTFNKTKQHTGTGEVFFESPADLSSSAMACSKKTNTPLPPDIFSPGAMVYIQPTPPLPNPECSSPGAMVCAQDKKPAASKAVVELDKA